MASAREGVRVMAGAAAITSALVGVGTTVYNATRKQPKPPAPPVLPPPPDVVAEQAANAQAANTAAAQQNTRTKGARGRRSTILAAPSNAPEVVPLARKTLLGQ